ncbi:MAG TPA: hypothetical protein VJZ76_15365, partial [Thermoanaerobaculia bacterium]|nr:hypothetical protein [Thermoanaerobaculia bacterium]
AMLVLGVALPALVAYRNAGWQAGAIAVYRSGDVIRAKAPLRIETPSIGVVDVGAGATLRILSNHRLGLDVGTIHAKTTSPPGLFVVDTPSTQAVDLGCEYTLDVAKDRSGVLHVTEGWVELGDGFVQSLVPRGASATFTADGTLSPPVFDDASPEFKDAVRRHDVPRLTAAARPRDALTLINLLRHAYGDDRRLLFDRLAKLVPPPSSVTFDSIRWDEWWMPVLKASGVEGLKKKKK